MAIGLINKMIKKIYPCDFYNEISSRINGIYQMIFRFNTGIMQGYLCNKYLYRHDKIRKEKLATFELYEYMEEVSYPEYYYSKNFHIYCNYEDNDRFDYNFSMRKAYHKAEVETVYSIGSKILHKNNHSFDVIHTYIRKNIHDDFNVMGWLKITKYRNFKIWTHDYDTNFKINKFFKDYFPPLIQDYMINNIYSYLGNTRQNIQMLMCRNKMFETLKRNYKNMKTYMKDIQKNKYNKIQMYKQIKNIESSDSDSD